MEDDQRVLSWVTHPEPRASPSSSRITSRGRGTSMSSGASNEFVLYDDAQLTRRDWRNRNRIKTPDGLKRLTVPVEVRGKYDQAIKGTCISDPAWREKHWKSLYHAYSKAPFLFPVRVAYRGGLPRFLGRASERDQPPIPDRYLRNPRNRHQDHVVHGLLGNRTEVGASFGHLPPGWRDRVPFGGFGTGDQSYPPFEHHVTVLDLIFHAGTRAPEHMLSGSSR